MHELGHFLTAKHYDWNIDKIYIYPYGGYSKFNDDINRPLKEELIILLMGPIFQIIYYLLFRNIFSSFFMQFHYSILFFNIIPIYPLDGGKLLNILLSYKFSFLKSIKVTIFSSYVILFLLAYKLYYDYRALNNFMIVTMVLIKLIEESRNMYYYFNKFLLERYLKDYIFKKKKIISEVKRMCRDTTHVIKYDNAYCTEKEIIDRYFKNVKKRK